MSCIRVLLVALLLAATPTLSAADGAEPAKGQPLYVGWATADITPPKPVALTGQLHKRISQGVRDPLTATVLALETRGEAGEKEQAVMVSCDLLFILHSVQERLQEKIKTQLPDFDAKKLFLNATHTHDGPGFSDGTFKGLYDVSKDAGVMRESEYAEFFVDRVAQAVVEAWQGRKPGGLSWAMGYAMVGFNRRAQFFDGHTAMYGDTGSPSFSNVEGHADPAVGMLFLWQPDGKLTGVVINIACTSQETENLDEISADFWHEVREELRKRHGKDLFVFPQCAAAGDQSPHPIYRKQAEQAMDQRRGLTRRQEIARRIANAVDDVLPVAKADVKSGLVFRHTVAARRSSRAPAAAPAVLRNRFRPSGRDSTCFVWATWPSRPIPSSCTSTTPPASRPAAAPR